MKIAIYKKIKTVVEVDVNLIASNLISNNIDNIVDSLIDEFYIAPDDYVSEDIEIDESIKEALQTPIRNELEKLLQNA